MNLLPWLVESAGFPEHDLFWRTSNQGALRRGRFKYLYDRRDRAVLGNWPRRDGAFHLLYDLTVDGREQADIASDHPELLAELRTTWARIDADLLSYPPSHPGVPRAADARHQRAGLVGHGGRTMIRDLLSRMANLAVLVFAVTSMLSVGLAHSAKQILGPLRDLWALVRALLANFLLVPLLAIGIVRLWPLDRPLEAGLILVAMSAGAPFLIKLAEVARSEVALSATLLVLLLPATVVYAPFAVPRVLPEAEVSAGGLAAPLFLTMLLPLGAGLLVNTRWRAPAQRWAPVARSTSTVALVVIVLTTTLANIPAIVTLFAEGRSCPHSWWSRVRS